MALLRKLPPAWLQALALLVVVGLSYGIWIPWLGLYGNDVPYLWYYHMLGVWGPGLFASVDRPISALFYAAGTALLGETTWHYHVFLLILRGLSGILLAWVLRIVWPGRDRLGTIAAILFVVYPGFRQNPVSLEFILHIAVLDLFLVSLGTMLLAVCQPRRQALWLLVSALTAASIFFLEYFIGLEILRLIFLWIVFLRAGLPVRKRWLPMLRAWLPALLVVLAFIFWRIFVFQFRSYQPVLLDSLRESPWQAMTQLGGQVVRDISTSLVSAWLLVLQIPSGRLRLLAYLGLVVGAAGVVFVILRQVEKDSGPVPDPERTQKYLGETVLGIGLVTMLAGGVVLWVTGIPVSTEFPWDRSTLTFMLGASLVGAGLLEMGVTSRYRALLAAVLVGLAVGTHFQNALVYNQEWKKLQSFFWQLTWRAPGLEPGTLILFDEIPLNRYSDSDLTALLNWTYAPGHESRQIPYKFFDLTIRLGSEYTGLPGVERDLPVEHNHRGLFFQTTTSHMLVVQYAPPACLAILRPQDKGLPGLSDRLVSVLPLIEMAQINTEDPQARPPGQLGKEPPHDWCYYYQKAELARQQEDWKEISWLGDQAFGNGYRWNRPAELLPFIEGYARTGNFEQASELTFQVNATSGYQPILCGLWKQIGAKQNAEASSPAQDVQIELGCTD